MALFDFLKKLFGTDTGGTESAPEQAPMAEPANEGGQPEVAPEVQEAPATEAPAEPQVAEPTDTPQV